MKVKLLMLVCLLMAVLVAVGCAPTKAPTPKAQVPAGYESLRIASGSVGGSAATAVMAITAVLNKHYPEIEWSSNSANSGTSMIYITKGTIRLAHTSATAYIDAYGFGKIMESRVRSVASHQPPLQYIFLIPADKPWKDITEVPKGTNLCPGNPGTTETVCAEACLKLCGLTKQDFNWLPMGKTEMTDAWRTGKVDVAFVGLGGMPPYIMDMHTSPRKCKPLGLSPEQVAKAKAEQTFEPLGFQASTMSILTQFAPEIFKYDVMCPQQAMLMCSRDDFPEDIAYKMAKVIDEYHAELVEIYPSTKFATPEMHIRWGRPPVDIHPGVAKYYKEKGYLK